MILITLLVALILGVSFRLWQREKAGIAWDGDATRMMRRLIKQETKVHTFELRFPKDGGTTIVARCEDQLLLRAFENLSEITKFGEFPLGRVIPATLKVDTFLIDCDVILEGSRVTVLVSNGLFGDGTFFRLPRYCALEKWIVDQVGD